MAVRAQETQTNLQGEGSKIGGNTNGYEEKGDQESCQEEKEVTTVARQ
jgi:hypothetical protein